MSITKLDFSAYTQMVDDSSSCSASVWNNMWISTQTAVNSLIDAVSPSMSEKFYVNGTETTPTDGVVSLTAGGTYVLTGTLNGRVVVSGDSPTTDTFVVLNNCKIYNDSDVNKALVYEPTAQSMQVTLAPNTQNILQCTNIAEISEQQGACLYSENNMILQGNGYLAVQNKGGHGIKASELRISGNPHVYADTNHDGVHGNSSLSIDGGLFYITNANDAFGTGTTGSIVIFGGEFYAYGITQKVFDSKVAGYIFKDFYLNTDSSSDNLLSGMTKIDPKVYFGGAVQNTSDGGYSTEPTGTVKCYTDEAMTSGETVISAVSGVYTLTTAYAKVEGYIEGDITTSIQSTNIELSNAYILGDIEYTATKKKLQINVEKDNIGMVAGNVTSSSNLAVEVKGGAHFNAYELKGDELTFNDSKGVAIIDNNVEGKDIYIGTAATPDSTKFLQGALMVKGTIKAILNSKFNKGWIHVLASNLTGVFCADTIDVAGYADLNGSTHVFFHKSNGMVIGTKTVESEDYKTV